MKTIEELIKENQEEQIDEGLADVLRIGTEIALLSGVIALFVKSVKDIAQGENGMLEIISTLKKDAKVNKICKKLAKDEEIQKILMGKENLKKDAFEEAVKSKLSEKDAKYFLDITKEKVQEYIKK